MSAALFPSETGDLLWHFNEAAGEIKQLRSSFPDEARLKAEGEFGEVRGIEVVVVVVDGHRYETRYEKSGMWCGSIEPNETRSFHATTEMNERALWASARDKRIGLAIAGADAAAAADVAAPHERWTCAAPPSKVLELCFGQPLSAARAMFDVAGARVCRTLSMMSGNKLDRERVRILGDFARSQHEHGPGSVAHLVSPALEAYAAARTQRDIGRWVDQLGVRLQRGKASPGDRALQRAIYAAVEDLEVFALSLYRKAMRWVPAIVSVRARARDAA